MSLILLGKLWKWIPGSLRRWLTRRFQTSFTVSAAGVITNENGDVLLLNHVLRPVSRWGIPGGFLDAGEQPEAAFRREIREETGLELSDVSLQWTRTLNLHIEIIFAAKAIGEPIVKSREIIELAWFGLDDMPKEMTQDQQVLILKILRPADMEKENG